MSTLTDLNAQTIDITNQLAGLATQITQLQILIGGLLDLLPAPPPPPPPPASTFDPNAFIDLWSSVDNIYTRYVTSEHKKPKFLATVALTIQPFVDQILLLQNIPGLYDLDVCVGQQEDVVGEWVGITRYLTEPIQNIYFAWDTPGVGWDQGTWYSAFHPTTELDTLPDDSYRMLLRFKIAANQWDGTIPSAYDIFDNLFRLTGISLLIQDNNDMSMIFALLGPIPDAVFQSLFTQGELILRPAGVSATLMSPSVANNPYFGFDVQNSSISGWDAGAWGLVNAVI